MFRFTVYLIQAEFIKEYEGNYIYIVFTRLDCLKLGSGSWSPRSINRESHRSSSASSEVTSSLLTLSILVSSITGWLK